MDGYVVVYAKFTECKEKGSELEGVYFGGYSRTAEEAETLAKSCVNSNRDYILPKITKISDSCQVVDVLYTSEEYFEKIQKQMTECHETIQRTNTRRK
jgi:prephenate dehydrogenase